MNDFPLEYDGLNFNETFYCFDEDDINHYADLMHGDAWVTYRNGDMIGVVTPRQSEELPTWAKSYIAIHWKRLRDDALWVRSIGMREPLIKQ